MSSPTGGGGAGGGRVVHWRSKHHVGQAQGRGQKGAHHPPGLQVYGGAGAGEGGGGGGGGGGPPGG